MHCWPPVFRVKTCRALMVLITPNRSYIYVSSARLGGWIFWFATLNLIPVSESWNLGAPWHDRTKRKQSPLLQAEVEEHRKKLCQKFKRPQGTAFNELLQGALADGGHGQSHQWGQSMWQSWSCWEHFFKLTNIVIRDWNWRHSNSINAFLFESRPSPQPPSCV